LRRFVLAADSSMLEYGLWKEGPECLWGGTRGGGSEEESSGALCRVGYFEDCAANRQSLRNSSYVKTTCSPRSPFSRRPRPHRRAKRRMSVMESPNNTAARCSLTCSRVCVLICKCKPSTTKGASSHPNLHRDKCFVICDKAPAHAQSLYTCVVPYTNSAAI
jgi:hypothetical protein